MNTVFLGLGSNVGNREQFVYQALNQLDAHSDCEVVRVSSLIDTEAVSEFAQPRFLNGAAICHTLLSAEAFLALTQEIEITLGRTEKGTNGPRAIDLDILFFNDEIIRSDHLTIPHPRLHERHFVLKPLAELAPDFVHPVLQQPIRILYDRVKRY